MDERTWISTTTIGVDEAGCGCLAGPVVAAAVVLDPTNLPDGINDSKVLRPEQRALLETQIKSCALAWSVAFVDNQRIDDVNILQATYDAMHAAIDTVVSTLLREQRTAELLLIDGNRFRPHHLPHRCIVDGDAHNIAIGAASILAKVARDRWMIEEADRQYPQYGFAQHKGYGTVKHRESIRVHGACPLHRISFLSSILTSE